MRARVLGTWAICVLAAYGCGGGGGSSTPPPSPDAHDAPLADAAIDRGADQRPDAAGGDTSADRGDTAAADAARDGNADARDSAGVDAGVDTAAPTCSDGIKNSDETDIDCGGHCGKCGTGRVCVVGADCTFGVCRTNRLCGECNLSSDCPGTETECVHRSCTAGVCGMSLAATGTVLAQQTVGDCQSRQCAVDGTVKMVPDNSDIHDDRNPCTNDTCASGVPMNAMLPINSSCGGQNRCNAAGQCVGCLTGTDCPGSDTVCQTRTCTAGICGFNFKASGFALNDPTAGDCKGQQCDGMGNIATINNDTDLPVDGNPCTTDECGAGTPAHHPIASGTTCGTGLVCDGATHCVACLTTSTCPGTDTECHTRTCVNGACGVSNTAAGTVTVAQTARDCKRIECNGNGGTFTVPDVADVPVDGNACTNDVCNGDTPTNPAIMAGTNCGGTNVCDGAGVCVGCLTAATCPGSDTECHTRTCSAAHQCGILNATTGKLLAVQMVGDCHRDQCDGAGNPQTVIDNTDVHVDGNVCTDDVCTNGTPTNPSLAQGTSCGTSLMCNGNGQCVGCVTAADCGVDTACLKHTCTAAGQCMVNPVPNGTVLTDPTVGDCKRSQCDGMGNIAVVIDDTDVPIDGNQCTQDVCTSGTPSNPPVPADTACNQNGGSRCNGIAGASVCVQCNTVSQCPGDDNECHARTCSAAGMCGVVNTAAGTVVSDPAGNCQRKQCDNTGNIATVADPTDVQDDGTTCTVDACSGMMPTHTPVTQGTLCGDHNGVVCNATGACVGCNFAGDCPGADTECQTRICALGMCAVSNTPDGTVVTGSPPGDCHKNVCSGGNIVPAVDPTDVFVDGKQCTDDVCSAGGMASNPAVTPSGTTCNQNGGSLCDATGACVKCLSDANCDTSHDDVCNKTHCVAGACIFAPVDANTAAGDPTPGDCHKNVCDSLGAVTSVADDTDVPVDGLACTQDICTGGVATNPPVTPGTGCTQNGGTHCDSSGACVPSFMVARIGDGSGTPLTSAATAIAIEERAASDGTLVRTINVPSTGPSPAPLTVSGVADSEGALALSGDKHSVAIAGYAVAAGTAGVAGSVSGGDAGAATPIQRGAALIFANGTVDTSTTFGMTTFSGDNVRAAVSNDGTQVWSTGNTSGAGSQRGVFISTIGTSASTLIESATNAGHVCEIIGGHLYCDAAKGVQGIFSFATALPTIAALATPLPGTIVDANASYYAFVMLDLDGNSVIDTMYVADDRATALGGIQKWSFSAGTAMWTQVWETNTVAGTVGVRGLTGYAVGSSAVLLATTASASPAPNAIIRLVDSGPTPTGASITTLVPAVTGQVTVFRGIALAPQ